MGKKLRKFNRATHRDLGYFFVAMILIYSISGIAINHIDDWNPSYVVKNTEKKIDFTPRKDSFDRAKAKQLLAEWKIKGKYRKFYWKGDSLIKIFFKGGTALINVNKHTANIETLKRRPFLYTVNWLHYNPNVYWTWFSDIFAVALILLAITGMFILKGKNGLKWRGTILIVAGIIVPLIFILIF